MMETFSYCYTIDPNATVSHSTISAQFGDGYEQAASNGINQKSSKWNLRFAGSKASMAQVISFLDAHGEWKRFIWTDPLGVQNVYRAGPYSPAKGGGNKIAITVEFRQVGAV